MQKREMYSTHIRKETWIIEAQGRITLSLWSWRESNPRPNEEAIRFLHAYLRLNFRV